MGNLGLYQTMTSASKKVGGPIGFVVCVAAAGYAVGRVCEAVGKKVVKSFNGKKDKQITAEYVIHTDGTTDQGLSFSVGEKFKVLDNIDDGLLIEKIGDDNNPYVVSLDFISKISSYKPAQKDSSDDVVVSECEPVSSNT